MAKNSSFRTIPAYQEKLLKSNSLVNFSLYFPRMVSWELEHGDGKFQKYTGKEIKYDNNGKAKWVKQNNDYMEELANAGNTLLKRASSLLTNIHKLQNDYIEDLKGSGIKTFEVRAKTISPFITGLGSGHPTETGMILDRNTGLPYIPASSIKGVLRLAYAVNLANEKYADGNVPNVELIKYFGSESDSDPKRGQLIILDAYPEQVPKLKLDIMNSHFKDYYRGKDDNGTEHKQPVETENPNPKKFLVVVADEEKKEEIRFVFRCAFIPLKNDSCDESEIRDMFKTAFETIGFGGKTSIGYGRFEFKEIQE